MKTFKINDAASNSEPERNMEGSEQGRDLEARRQHRRAYTQHWFALHKGRYAAKRKIYYQKKVPELKREIFTLLGGKCSSPDCPILPEKMDPFCLQIDHVHNDGWKTRKQRRGIAYWRRTLKAIKNGSGDYQILCVYCNWKKRWTVPPRLKVL